MMEVKSIMENKLQDLTTNKNINMMGSEVVDGFACKPKKLVPNKPIMHFKTHIFICNDGRCGGAHKNDEIASDLRNILKEINLFPNWNSSCKLFEKLTVSLSGESIIYLLDSYDFMAGTNGSAYGLTWLFARAI